jgi:hypothetical protein
MRLVWSLSIYRQQLMIKPAMHNSDPPTIKMSNHKQGHDVLAPQLLFGKMGHF